MTGKQLEAACLLFRRISDKESDNPELWREIGYRTYALSLFEECSVVVTKMSGGVSGMQLIIEDYSGKP